jgi:hypothetical protein
MRKLDLSYAVAPLKQPVKKQSLDHIQDGMKDAVSAAILASVRARLGGYTTNDVVVLDGCENSGSGSNYIISAGWVYYNGEVYQVAAATFSTSGAQVPIATINNGFDLTIDPTKFSDLVNRNVHKNDTVVIAAGTSGAGIADFTDFKRLDRPSDEAEITLASQNTTNTSFVDATGLTFTTPDDGVTRKYSVFLKGNFHILGAHTGAGGEARLLMGASTQLDANSGFGELSAGTYAQNIWPFTCVYNGPIAPNTTVKVQFRTRSASYGIDLNDAKLSYFERV